MSDFDAVDLSGRGVTDVTPVVAGPRGRAGRDGRDGRDGGVQHRTAYPAHPGANVEPGWHIGLDLDYDTTDPDQPEPWMVRVRTALGALVKTFWLNESGLPRAWAVRKDEPALKVHAYADNADGPVFEVRGPWNRGAIRRLGINSRGQLLLGPRQVPAGAVVSLPVGTDVPADLPPGTVIAWTE
ncbi:hypothetical protein [Nocardioides nanhaiensis]|uniref:Uncharacterized protein n=1 Tax=Nocardioides nanhaiensis TaxID=1476871 RepID=A0ABP8W4W4_9ACTN